MINSDYLIEFEEKLKHIPKGELFVETHQICQDEAVLQTEHFNSFSDGVGITKIFPVFSGIEVSLNQFCASRFSFHHEPMHSVIQINHCRNGRMGWELKDGSSIYLGAGDISLHMLDTCAESEMSLPLGFYEGMAISVDTQKLAADMPEIINDAGIDAVKLTKKFCGNGKVTALPASEKISHIFSEMYDLPEKMCIPYFKLKVQELLLFLDMLEVSEEKELTKYFSEQVEIIKEIHKQLTENLDKRFTIEELSKQYPINTSSMKSVFKAVYGSPIASYMKEFRMKQAAVLLRDSNKSIAEISEAVGYESQSKFSNAFKEVMQILPAAYRKQYRN